MFFFGFLARDWGYFGLIVRDFAEGGLGSGRLRGDRLLALEKAYIFNGSP